MRWRYIESPAALVKPKHAASHGSDAGPHATPDADPAKKSGDRAAPAAAKFRYNAVIIQQGYEISMR